MEFVPMNGKILLKRDDPQTVTAAGIIIPGDAQEKSQFATVVAVAEAQQNGEAMSVKVADRVMIQSFASQEIQMEGISFLLVGEDEILGKITPD